MAKANPNALPEISTTDSKLVTAARNLGNIQAQIASLQTQEKTIKKDIAEKASLIRKTKADEKEFIGLVRITGTDIHPYRVEFKMGNCPIDVDQEQVLDELYGPSRPLLFERALSITDISNPTQAIKDLESQGKNPWDYLEIRVKDGMDRAVADATEYVVGSEAFIPVKGFLAKLYSIAGTLAEAGLKYTREILDAKLSPYVCGGAKGKA